jgi:hypothetical protein
MSAKRDLADFAYLVSINELEPNPWDDVALWEPVMPPPRSQLDLEEGFAVGMAAADELRRLRAHPTLSDAQRRRVEHCQQVIAKELQRQPATMRVREVAVGRDTGAPPPEAGPGYRAVKMPPKVTVEVVKRRKVPPRPRPETESERILRLAVEAKARRRAERKARRPWSTPCLIEVIGAEADATRRSLAVYCGARSPMSPEISTI